MPTDSQINAYAARVLQAAIAGTPTNPAGLPAPLASLVLAQARHETDNFSSEAFTQGNNLFGYSYVPGAKWQLPAPNPVSEGSRQMAAYATVEDSVGEIVDWLYRRRTEGVFPSLSTITTPEQYAGYLKAAGFYTASENVYLAGLQRWWQALTPAELAGGWVGFLVLAAIVGYIVYKKKKRHSNAY